MKTTGRLLAALAVLTLLLLAGCGADADDTIRAATGPTIKDSTFSHLDVKAGAKVVVTNEDTIAHTFTANDKSFDTSTIDPGKTATFTAPSKAGSYDVHCTIHATMKGTLKVT